MLASAMLDYATVSFWLESCGDDLAPRPALPGPTTADVAILGGGYTGLWTTYYLLRQQPGLRVVVLERDICGFGASGRNGAWCAPGLNISLARLEKLHGTDAARATYRAVLDAVDEVGNVAERESIDIDWRRGGELIVARGPHETPSIESDYEELTRFGLADDYQVLDADALARRVRIGSGAAALYTTDGAALHPAKLARGLARVVERLGGTIHEQTEVTSFRAASAGGNGRGRPALVTEAGEVTADVVV